MITFTEALRLLAVVAAYGIAGRMDHDDAVMLDDAPRATTLAADTTSLQANADTCKHRDGKRQKPPAP